MSCLGIGERDSNWINIISLVQYKWQLIEKAQKERGYRKEEGEREWVLKERGHRRRGGTERKRDRVYRGGSGT